MDWFLLASALWLAGGVAALLCGRASRLALGVGTAGGVLGSGVGLAAAVRLLLEGGDEAVRIPWEVPLGTLCLGVDALSAFFLLCIFLVSGLAAVYGAGYLRARAADRRLGPVTFFFALLVTAMAVVVLARDGVLFLVAWELMSIAGYFLVTFDDDHEEVRRAGFVYLVASQIGVACLFLLFALLARPGGDFSFAAIADAGPPNRAIADAVFLLALVGFGTKAGFWMLHTWLPEAHPAAPSHVSATMSGVMIKLGIYGVLRVLTLLGPPPLWWGLVLIVIGLISGLLGVLHALAQHDLKRLLAYHSVENIGIIALGIGVGLVGVSTGAPAPALLGYAGAILHTLNHGLFKGLLFQGAGSVLHATGTREIDRLGGLSRAMPVTAATFLVGAVAISGLPPLNGFVSEWLLLVAAFRGGAALHGGALLAVLAVIPGLALIGGLAAACFVKAYGIVFLGQPRDPALPAAHEAPPAMCVPMVLGAALCVGIGLWPEGALRLVARPAALMAGAAAGELPVGGALGAIARVGLLLVGLIAALALVRRALLRRRSVTVAATWGCGYEAPSPRMQYTASSFADPVLEPFAVTLHRPLHEEPPAGCFPAAARYERHPGDLAGARVFAPAARVLRGLIERLRVIQHGRVQLYLVYILVTVVVLLVWQFSGGRP